MRLSNGVAPPHSAAVVFGKQFYFNLRKTKQLLVYKLCDPKPVVMQTQIFMVAFLFFRTVGAVDVLEAVLVDMIAAGYVRLGTPMVRRTVQRFLQRIGHN